MDKVVICADVIVFHRNKLVVVERQSEPIGLALPGGQQEMGETLSATAIRECKEETGLKLLVEEVVGTYAEKGRDPRGNYVSTVFLGLGTGRLSRKGDKTKPILLSKKEVAKRSDDFVFDHYQVIQDYFEHFHSGMKERIRGIKIIKSSKIPKQTKFVQCKNCGSLLEYAPEATKEYRGTDYTGGDDGRIWIVCPVCKKDVTLESW